MPLTVAVGGKGSDSCMRVKNFWDRMTIKHAAGRAQWACSTEQIAAAAGSGPLISPAGAGGGYKATPAAPPQAPRAV